LNLPLSFKPNLEVLKRHLGVLVRERNFETSPAALLEAQRYIKEGFQSCGLEVSEFPFPFQGKPRTFAKVRGKTFFNLTARSPGVSSSLPRLIIGAHFDAVPGSPGADDNASGVACLLEAARIYALVKGVLQRRHCEDPALSAENAGDEAISKDRLLRFARNDEDNPSKVAVEFAAFNLEEYGMVGSQAYARRLKAEGAKVAGMLSLEMVGYSSKEKGSQQMPFFLKPFYPDVGNFIGLVANTASRKLLERVQRNFKSVEGLPVESLIVPANGWVFPDARLSDHSPFWDEGFPALLVTDTSFFRNPHYHSPADRIETLDLDFLAKVTEAVTRTVAHQISNES